MVAWAAGVIEGEGSILLKPDYGAVITIQMTDLDVLEKVQGVFGGRIFKTKTRKSHWKQAWKWQIADSKSLVDCLEEILPYLMSRRKEAALKVLDERKTALKRKQVKQAEVNRVRSEVKRLHKEGTYTHRKLAEKFGLERSYVTHIINGRYD